MEGGGGVCVWGGVSFVKDSIVFGFCRVGNSQFRTLSDFCGKDKLLLKEEEEEKSTLH